MQNMNCAKWIATACEDLAWNTNSYLTLTFFRRSRWTSEKKPVRFVMFLSMLKAMHQVLLTTKHQPISS